MLKAVKLSRTLDRSKSALAVYRRGFVDGKLEPDNFTLNTLLACCEPAKIRGSGWKHQNVQSEKTDSESEALDFDALFRKFEKPDRITYLNMVKHHRYSW